MDKVEKPCLTLLAGPNGAGKSSFSSYLGKIGLIFTKVINIDDLEEMIDYDFVSYDPLRYQNEFYKQLDKVFQMLCKEAVRNKNDFAYECNFRKSQIQHVKFFDDADYKFRLIFFWIDSLDISEDRVRKRVSQGGHNVSKNMIMINFEEGVNNLNESWIH